MSTLQPDAVRGSGGEGDTGPLNDRERAAVQRLLSDPFAFPQSFKTWIVAYLEASDLTLPLSSVLGLEQRLKAIEARLDVLEP